MEKQKRSKLSKFLWVVILIAMFLLCIFLPKKGSSQVPDRWNVDVIHEQMGVNQVIKKDTSDLFLSGASIRYVPRKDTFIKVDGEEYLWYNAATWTYVDSSVYYNNLNFLTSILLKYRQECYNDSTKATYDFYKYGNDTVMRMPSCDPGFHQGYIGRKSIYEHKQPTFADFIDWLERRNK